ncbi:tetratricopeptide repeat protein [Geobacter sulfurreducens]|uniref:tetratricopeptide repeat protein n=1 Tax=Geobacter sulfurreducens TaxID=35554 RepID=UPI002BBB0F75|nr:tetratricopeptide repeat protein [Geobacter sulfurreducens]HML78520.1 tetratricopeptide repeat protein [Geobacter sulfurreducens]
MMKTIIPAVMLVVMPCAALASAPADLFRGGKIDEAVTAYRATIGQASAVREKAMLHKELGDLYAEKDQYTEAADEYVAALALDHGFPTTERIRMAVAVSWANRLDDAIFALRAVVADEPDNTTARTHLARTLSWRGDQPDAIAEADRVLAARPGDRDALLVKANALRWQGNSSQALPLYQLILAGSDDFDTRLGLAFAQLQTGNKQEAAANAAILKPRFPYQERDLKRLREEIENTTANTVEASYTRYGDSDDNKADRFGVAYTHRRGDGSLSGSYRHFTVNDTIGDTYADILDAGGYLRLAGRYGVGAGIGVARLDSGSSDMNLTWRLNADADVARGGVSLSLRKDVLTDTASLVENRIRYLSAGISASQRITQRFTLFGGYSWRDYSDDNSAHDLLIAPSYTLYAGDPTVRTGYRFRYLNFDRQSFGGYFDPNDFISHQLFVSVDWQLDRIFLYAEPYGGFQSFDRYGDHTDDIFGGFSGTLGYRFTKRLTGEVNGELGNYALGATSGFEYYSVGTRFAYSF